MSQLSTRLDFIPRHLVCKRRRLRFVQGRQHPAKLATYFACDTRGVFVSRRGPGLDHPLRDLCRQVLTVLLFPLANRLSRLGLEVNVVPGEVAFLGFVGGKASDPGLDDPIVAGHGKGPARLLPGGLGFLDHGQQFFQRKAFLSVVSRRLGHYRGWRGRRLWPMPSLWLG